MSKCSCFGNFDNRCASASISSILNVVPLTVICFQSGNSIMAFAICILCSSVIGMTLLPVRKSSGTKSYKSPRYKSCCDTYKQPLVPFYSEENRCYDYYPSKRNDSCDCKADCDYIQCYVNCFLHPIISGFAPYPSKTSLILLTRLSSSLYFARESRFSSKSCEGVIDSSTSLTVIRASCSWKIS